MNRKVQLSEETSSQNNTADKRNRERVINVVYIIAASEITWMFLQFSITPVSISAMAKQEAEISVHAMNAIFIFT